MMYRQVGNIGNIQCTSGECRAFPEEFILKFSTLASVQRLKRAAESSIPTSCLPLYRTSLAGHCKSQSWLLRISFASPAMHHHSSGNRNPLAINKTISNTVSTVSKLYRKYCCCTPVGGRRRETHNARTIP